ncbi:MAG: pirin family protein [Rhodothermaceae bacterium]|nr:pirin family protein [Rhodothermaceae bacterium]
MPTLREILTVVPAQPINMGGFRVKQPLPHDALDQIDPFLLLHHARSRITAGSRPQAEGVPPHPHRGFEPVTFIYQGGVHHRDSRGNDSVIGPGGVQWMTAGLGIVHSERPPRALTEAGGEQEIIQLWINLPARAKRAQPRYQGYQADQLPTVERDSAVVQVVAGSFEGTEGPVETHSPITALNLALHAGSAVTIPLPEDHHAFLYLLDGRARINDAQEVAGEHLVRFAPEGEAITVEASASTRALLMAGAPLNEPVVASGPFVMTSTTEILEAMRDYQQGKMGILVETF